MRFKIQEITPLRLIQAVGRRVAALPNAVSWKSDSIFRDKMKSFHNIHKGERCFIIANGPSLKKTDLSFLKNEYTIGMNRIYLLFNEHFKTTYHAVINELVIEQFKDELAELDCIKFIDWKKRDLFKNLDMNYVYISQALQDGFSYDLTKNVYSGGTVTYVCMQLAYYMGFTEVVLIGLDHNFVDKGTPNKTEVRSGDDHNHFHPDYFPKGMKWQLPDLLRSELAYAKAREAYKSDGRKIVDATYGGKCEVFEKVDYLSLFKNSK
ncbi:hypothetical protein ACVWYN_000056 [Pedobacter sp. UYP24]